MPLPIYPIGIGLLTLVAWFTTRGRAKNGAAGKSTMAGEMTPERQIIYQTALSTTKDPLELQKLAAAFRKEGLVAQAILLDKRAKLRTLPDEVKEARRQIYREAMDQTDPDKVEKLADAFEKEGATGAAAALKEYAQSLRKAASEGAAA